MNQPDWKRVKEAKDALHDESRAHTYAEKLAALDRMRERAESLENADRHTGAAAVRERVVRPAKNK